MRLISLFGLAFSLTRNVRNAVQSGCSKASEIWTFLSMILCNGMALIASPMHWSKVEEKIAGGASEQGTRSQI